MVVGVLTSVLDVLKAACGVWLVRALFADQLPMDWMPWAEITSGIMSVIGHNWSVFLGWIQNHSPNSPIPFFSSVLVKHDHENSKKIPCVIGPSFDPDIPGRFHNGPLPAVRRSRPLVE